MHLTDRQLDRFFDLLDGLIVFANDRLHLVDSLVLPIVGDEAEMKAAYVCDMLWRHIEVIDEYVRVNPNRLRPADLEAVAAWKDALIGRFTLVRFERGRAILMNEAGLFAVAGLDEDPQKRLPICPDMTITTLLPFEGMIISDGLMFGDGIPLNEDERAGMESQLAEHEAAGIAWTPEEFVVKARAYNEKQREDEFDDLMSSLELEARQAREGEKLPAGFHRGVLAGLPEDERERMVRDRFQEVVRSNGLTVEKVLKAHAPQAEPSESLADCLVACMKRDDLVSLCRVLEVRNYGSKNKRAIAAMLVEPLAQARDFMVTDLNACANTSFELFNRVVAAGGRCEDDIATLELATISEPLQPYVFQFRHEGKLVSIIPRELREMAASIDVETIAYEREREDAVVNCASAMGEYYGLLTLREAYELYRGAVVNAYSLEDFVGLLMREDSYDDMGFVLQQWNDDSYLMHYSVSDAHLADLVTRRYEDEVRRNVPAMFTEGVRGPTMARISDKIRAAMQEELVELDKYRKHVLEVRVRTPRRPLDAAAAEGTTFERYFSLPAMRQLRDFYDAHVPDGEDDIAFAERAVEELVTHAIDLGNVDLYLDTLEEAGWDKCAEDQKLLPRLVENAYGAMPSWEFNGWSPQEILENMSGRKVFYNARGELLHPGPDDACPCGSGKPYRDCHGK